MIEGVDVSNMERFERIKQYYSSMETLDSDIQEDVRWLISTVEELSTRLEGAHKYNAATKLTVEEQQKEIEELRKAGKFFENGYRQYEEENARLRKALEEIAECKNDYYGEIYADIAITALNEAK